MIKAQLGGHLRRRRGRGRGGRLLRAAAAAERRVSARRERRPAPRPRAQIAPEFSVLGVDGRRGRGRARRCASASGDRDLGPRGLHDRADGADQHRPGAARATTPRPASAWSTSSASPSAGRRRRTASCGRRSTHAGAELHGRDDVHARRAVHLRPRARGGQVLLQRCPTARCRSASTSPARSCYRGDDGQLQIVLVPWTCSARLAHAGRRRGAR